MIRIAKSLCFAFALCSLISAGAHSNPSNQPKRKVVMVVVPAASLDDMVSLNLPNIRGLIQTGAIGLMNSRTAGRIGDPDEGSFRDSSFNPESGFMTLGAGARAKAGQDARSAFNRMEKVDGGFAWQVLQRRTLIDPGKAAVVQIGMAKFERDKLDLNYDIYPGQLGAELHKAGFKTAVIGNSDDPTPHREVATICMDKNGLVDFGDVGASMSIADPSAPFGLTTNVPLMLRKAAECIGGADLTVIELGDTARLDRARLNMMDGSFLRQHVEAFTRMDETLGGIIKLINFKNTILLVITPYPSSYTLEKTDNSLCPVLVKGTGFTNGVLSSSSTRVPGVITNTDIAPSILEWLGLPVSSSLVGRTISASPNTSPVKYLVGLNNRATVQMASHPVLRQVTVAILVFVLIFTALWLIIPAGHPFRKKFFATGALLPSALAPALLLSGYFPSASQVETWITLILSTAILILAAKAIGRTPLRALMLLSLVFCAAIVVDLFTGGSLCRYSVMGYSIVDGARYYGIGNEYMGALIGASLLVTGMLLYMTKASTKLTQIIVSCALIIMVILIGAPKLGGKVGGIISIMVAYGFALAATSKKKLNFRKVATILLGVVVVLAIFAAADMFFGKENQSHLGKSIGLIGTGGAREAFLIAKRKLAMNLMLIEYSPWSRLLLAYVVGAGAMLLSKKNRFRFDALPFHMRVILAGTISGTVAALVVNDSGIVAAGTCFAYSWSLIMLSIVESK